MSSSSLIEPSEVAPDLRWARRSAFETVSPAPFVNVYVEGEDVRTLDGLETPVREGSTVILLPAMAGGAAAGG